MTIPAQAGTHLAGATMFFVYLLASKRYGTLYVGVTSDLAKRVWEHKAKVIPGFTSKYGVNRLVWFECHEEHASALQREKRIKEWKRDWKINLVERDSPHWLDLAPPFGADPYAVGGMGPRPSPGWAYYLTG